MRLYSLIFLCFGMKHFHEWFLLYAGRVLRAVRAHIVSLCLSRLDPRDCGGMEASPTPGTEQEHKASPPEVTKWELQRWAFPYQRGECGTPVS